MYYNKIIIHNNNNKIINKLHLLKGKIILDAKLNHNLNLNYKFLPLIHNHNLIMPFLNNHKLLLNTILIDYLKHLFKVIKLTAKKNFN